MYLSLTSANDLRFFSQLWKYDKVVHFVEYLGVGFLMINMLQINPMGKKHWRYALLFLLLFPLLDESLQYFAPYRIPDLYDGIVDICGGLIGAYIKKIVGVKFG